MLAEHSHAVTAAMDTVFAKTAEGRAEVARRAAGLNLRQRSVLIMLDGQKSVAALSTPMPAAQLFGILGELTALGLIRPAASTAPMPPALPAAARAPAPSPAAAAAHVPSPVPTPALSAARLAPVKAILIHTADTYLGLISADLVRQIHGVGDEAQLQRAIAHWHMAMQASKYGKEVVTTYLDQIKASLQGEPRAA